MVMPVLELHGAQRLEVTTAFPSQMDDAFRIGERDRPEKHRVHDAENRAVGAHAQRQGDDRHGGKRRCLAQRSQRIKQILTQRAHGPILLVPLMGGTGGWFESAWPANVVFAKYRAIFVSRTWSSPRLGAESIAVSNETEYL